MQQTYSEKKGPIQRIAETGVASIFDASSQSESLQRKADMVNNAAQREEAPRPNNTGMPDNLKSGIESLSGFSMDDVRVHYNSSKPATVQALAYTQGTDIHIAPGQEKHLPHEAWHVAQQMAGRVSPTTNINGMPVNDNAGLEHEADVMGEKALYDNFLVAETHASSKSHNTIQYFSSHKIKDNNKKVLQRVHIFVNEIQWERKEKKKEDESFDSTKEENPKIDESFDSIIVKALFEIQNQFVVDEICKAVYIDTNGKIRVNSDYTLNGNEKTRCPENWNDIIITEGNQCAFEGGGQKNNKLLLLMNIEQCKKSIFGNYEDFLHKEKIKDTTDVETKVASILLHELGHAHQQYLLIKNKDLPKKDAIESLKIYPIFFNDLYNISNKENQDRINKALTSYNEIASQKINVEEFMSGLILQKKETIEKVKNIISGIGKGANHPNLDSDNIFMNEIPYNKENNLGTRTYYGGMTTIGIVSFVDELKNISSSFGDKINKLQFNCSISFFENIWTFYRDDIIKILKDNLDEITDKTKDNDIFFNEMYFDLWLEYIKLAETNTVSLQTLKTICEKGKSFFMTVLVDPIRYGNFRKRRDTLEKNNS